LESACWKDQVIIPFVCWPVNVNGDVGGDEVSSEVRFCCIQSPRKLTIFYVKAFVPLEGNNLNNLFYQKSD